jgi:hypothetical protein
MSSSSTVLVDTAMGSGVVVSAGGGLLLEGRVASTFIDVGGECLVSMPQLDLRGVVWSGNSNSS